MGSKMLTPTQNVSMTTAQRDLLPSPAAGWIIHNSTTNQIEEYDGTSWYGRKDLRFTDLPDTIGTINSPDALMVVDATGTLVRTQVITRVIAGTVLASKTYAHAKLTGAKQYWEFGEGGYPFISALGGRDISASIGGSPVESYTSSPSILVDELEVSRSTLIGPVSDVALMTTGELIASNKSFTLGMTISLPASQLLTDLTDRTLFNFGVSGELIIRNGQVAYKQSSYEYHPATLVADTPIHIFVTREGNTGELMVVVNDQSLTLPSHTNVTALINSTFFSNGFSSYIQLSAEAVVLWERVLTQIEIDDQRRVRSNLPMNSALPSSFSIGELSDVSPYVVGDANKALVINALGTGVSVAPFIAPTQLIEDGLKGYISGAVPNLSICAMQIQNKALTIPTNPANSKFFALTAPVNTIVFDVIKYALGSYETEIIIGTVTFSAGSNTGVLSVPTLTNFIIGDMLAIRSPSGVEGIRDLFINLVGSGAMPLYT